MELKKQDVGVWVKASEELPEIEGIPIVINYGNHKHPFVTIFYNKRFVASEANDFGKEDYKNIEWLKPIEQVYVLTEDELAQFASEYLDNLNNKTPEQFIKSITK